jgi:hypothetical protein
MGLDMYAYRVKQEYATSDFEFESDQDPAEDLAYWRKFNALHGWMEDLYKDRGGQKESFNCAPIRLHPEDIDALEEAINENLLEPREGFFFGSQEIYPEDVASTKRFIADARQAYKDGFAVYYDSWW